MISHQLLSHDAGRPLQTVDGEIFRAHMLYGRFGLALEADHSVHLALQSYLEAIRQTHQLIVEVGVRTSCAACANQENGSCCFLGMEENFDHILMLINLLWGKDLPVERELPNQCLFLGRQGCKLLARYHFCVNYFCSDLKNRLQPMQWKILLTGVGAELSAGWEAEHILRHWLHQHA